MALRRVIEIEQKYTKKGRSIAKKNPQENIRIQESWHHSGHIGKNANFDKCSYRATFCDQTQFLNDLWNCCPG